MIALAAAVIWAGYGVGTWGWCLVMGYDVPLTGWFSPFAPFTWPAGGNPGFVRKGQIFPGGAPGTASTGTSANPANTPSAVGGANAANGAPSSTPGNPGVPPQPGTPSPGHGVIYPPGSQNL